MSLRISTFATVGSAVQAEGDKGQKGEKGLKGLPFDGFLTRAFTVGGGPGTFRAADSFPFSNPFTTATNMGVTTVQFSRGATGTQSDTTGFNSGGQASAPGTLIESFPFSANRYYGTIVGDLTQSSETAGGQSSSTHGYNSEGVIANFPFSSPFTFATEVGSLSASRFRCAGHSSSTDGYTSAGFVSPFSRNTNIIDSFPFSTPFTTASDVGNTSQGRYNVAGQSSSSDGYTSGGGTSPPFIARNTIDSFPFSVPFTTSTDVGDISQARRSTAGQSSDSDGYNSGGAPPFAGLNTIDSFPFSTPFTTATDVGDLSQGRYSASGTQG